MQLPEEHAGRSTTPLGEAGFSDSGSLLASVTLEGGQCYIAVEAYGMGKKKTRIDFP